MGLISVIVPIYNAEKYLRRCIDSILEQTYSNLEVLLIDDGATDKSGEICDLYKQLDDRVAVIHKPNGGLSSARNVGLEKASGEYIAFVDSDDWIVSDIYQYCIDIIHSTNCDVVDFRCVFTNGQPTTCDPNLHYSTVLVEGKEILRDYLVRGQTDQSPFSVCRKLYKRPLFNTIRFPVGKISEDLATNYKVLMGCMRLVHTDKIGYYYFQNGASITRNGLKKRDFDLLDACKELQALIANEEYPDVKYLGKVKYARSYFSLLAKLAFYGMEDKELNAKEITRTLTRKMREHYLMLMGSPMPINRKLMVTALCINLRCLSLPLGIYRRISRR
jgi:glycosyltransferase involved in cell wall biosynthesis